MKTLRIPLAFGLALYCILGHAQTLSEPKEFYFDQDASTTRAIVAVPGEGDAVVDRLAANVQRRPQDAESRAQLARIAMQDGRQELGGELYRAAQQVARGNARMLRAVTWNHGWDLYRAGQPQAALDQWAMLLGGWPTAPAWQPPTLALVLWTLGRRDEAVRWYAAAARTEPTAWRDPANFPSLLPGWTDEERKVLGEVFEAWNANPPTWP